MYGGYYATCVPVYAAIKIRSDALARTPLMVLRSSSFNAGGALSDDSGHSPGGTGTGGGNAGTYLPTGSRWARPTQCSSC